MSDVEAQIRAFIGRFARIDNLSKNENIFSGGYMNSLFVMQLIAWVESSYEIELEDDDLQLENFSSISAIESFIERKMSATTAT